MRLRAHHLLCTQSYHGEGYSEGFVQGMNAITHRLRTETKTPITLVLGTDDACIGCPNNMGENRCTDDDKVRQYDQRVLQAFGLTEGQYIYQELVAAMKPQLTFGTLQAICGDCAWFESAGCRSYFCKQADA